MPLQKHCWRHLDVPAKLFGGMPAQEQPVKEGRLPLREVEIVLGFVRRVGGGQQGRVGYSLHRLKRQKGKFTGTFPGVK